MAAGDSFGTDIDNAGDVPPNLNTVRGWRVLANAIVRRLSTPKGYLYQHTGDDEAQDYGEDLRDWLNLDITEADVAALEARVQTQCRADPRVLSAKVSARFTLTGTPPLQLTLRLDTEDGEFDLVLGVDKLTVEILDGPAEEG